MRIIKTASLAETLDALNDAFFFERPVPKAEREKVAKWIAKRQGLPGAYAGMFAPTAKDFSKGVRLFTGERVASRAAAGHVLGEEACRALIKLNVRDKDVKEALAEASRGMMARIKLSEKGGDTPGTYCCGTCTAAYWRNLAAGGFERPERRLATGLKVLKKYRLGDGTWRRFPFFYTLLALSEIDLAVATAEKRYAAPALEQYLKRPPRDDVFNPRRRLLAARVLERS